ncbi:hypothetical protein KM043_003620 [Ampulex compressa]|nr:hypothetical protein KM043_003620 [Ampulex compressa]
MPSSLQVARHQRESQSILKHALTGGARGYPSVTRRNTRLREKSDRSRVSGELLVARGAERERARYFDSSPTRSSALSSIVDLQRTRGFCIKPSSEAAAPRRIREVLSDVAKYREDTEGRAFQAAIFPVKPAGKPLWVTAGNPRGSRCLASQSLKRLKTLENGRISPADRSGREQQSRGRDFDLLIR